MASLYETSRNARKAIVVFLVFVLGAIIFDRIDFSQKKVDAVDESTRFYMYADRKFGNIEEPKIPGIAIDTDNNASFTKQFSFVQFPDVAYVYKINKPTDKPLTFFNAQQSVAKLGFNKDVYKEVLENNYLWTTDNGTRTLRFDSVTQKWILGTTYFNNVNALAQKKLLETRESYAGAALSLIKDLGFNTTGFDNGRVNVQYASLENDGSFLAQDRFLNSEYVFLNFQRRLIFADLKPSGERPKVEQGQVEPVEIDALVYSNDLRKGQISMVVSNEIKNYSKDVFQLNFTNFEYSTEAGKYLIISPDEAWTKVQTGKGSLTYIVPQGENILADMKPQNVVRYIMDASKTELAYWEPDDWSGLVYPIYIFTGRAELSDGRQATFYFYVEAIKRL